MDKWRAEGFPVVPLNRLASVDDIADAFLYLASDDATYVTGINLVVDGGAHCADLRRARPLSRPLTRPPAHTRQQRSRGSDHDQDHRHRIQA